MDLLDEIMSGMQAPKPKPSRSLEIARRQRAMEEEQKAM